MVSLLAGAGVWLLTRWLPALATAPQVELLLGILLIFGFAEAKPFGDGRRTTPRPASFRPANPD